MGLGDKMADEPGGTSIFMNITEITEKHLLGTVEFNSSKEIVGDISQTKVKALEDQGLLSNGFLYFLQPEEK